MSLLIITVSGLFIGLVLGLQGYSILVNVGSESMLGTMVFFNFIAWACTGRCSFALRWTSRFCIDCWNWFDETKWTACQYGNDWCWSFKANRITTSLGWYSQFANVNRYFAAIGIVGGKLVGVDFLGVDEGSFWSGMQNNVQFGHDVVNGIIKSIVFALLCTWIAVFQGYACDPTPEGIATAMTRTVVYSSLCVLGFDFVLTAVMFGGI